MKTRQMVTGSFVFLFSFFFLNLNAQILGSGIGSFDQFSDIGAPAIPGTASYSEPSQIYNITGSGKNIWFGVDNFSFLYKNMSGDFIIQTQVRFVGEGHELHRKSGIMFRSSIDSASPMVACTIHGDGLTSLQFRKTTVANVEEVKFNIVGPDVIQLEKKGNVFTMSVAHFGEVYQSEKIENLDLGVDLLSGLFVCAHTNKFSEEVVFSNARVFNTAPDDLVQYKTYLGSLLEVMDVETGHREIVASSDISLQAPNWTPDGKNQTQLTFDEMNNWFPHVSPDNNWLVFISFPKEVPADKHPFYERVYIRLMPIEGGKAKVIAYLYGGQGTMNVPSWSPDGKKISFVTNGLFSN